MFTCQQEQQDDMDERRKHWPKDSAFFTKVERHIAEEEERLLLEAERRKVGDERMDRIEQDLRPLNRLYWAVMGSGGVGAMLLAVLLFIYSDDRDTQKMMQDLLYKQGVAIEKLIQAQGTLESDLRREIGRVEAEQDRQRMVRP